MEPPASPPAASADRLWRGLDWGLAALVLAVALFLRCWHLSWIPALNGDEAWYAVVVRRLLEHGEFTWRTPTGNPINPFFLLPHLLVAAVSEPGVVALRLPALAYGLATLVAGGWAAWRLFGQTAGVTTVLLLACLPLNLVYARFSWDMSMAVLVGLLFLLACAQARLGWMVALFGACLIVHPTNLLLLPAGALIAAPRLLDRRDRLRIAAVIGVLAVLAVAYLRWNEALAVHHSASSLHPLWLLSRGHWLNLLPSLNRFLLGFPLYEHLAGPIPAWAGNLADLFILPVVAGVFLAGLVIVLRRRDWLRAGVLLGFFASIAACEATVGSYPLLADHERYGTYLVAPFALAVAALVSLVPPRPQRWLRPCLGGAALAGLVSFQAWFLQPQLLTGGNVAPSLRTADPEPKRQALQLLATAASPGASLAVWTEDWWLDLPLQYLAPAGHRYTWHSVGDPMAQPLPLTEAIARRTAIVVWAGSPSDAIAARSALRRYVVVDRGGGPLIHVYLPAR